MGDEEVELLVDSLKHNTKLTTLDLQRNNITVRSCNAILKLMVDVSSIESTYNSNNTLSSLNLPSSSDPTCNEIQSLIYGACSLTRDALYLNRSRIGDSDVRLKAVGRAKVIRYHLNSQTLKKLCQLQGIEYIHGSIFTDIETALPNILSLIGSSHGQSELYTALILTAPDLLSYMDRKAMLKDTLAKNAARATAFSNACAQQVAYHEQKIAALKAKLLAETSRLTAHNVEVNNRLELIELGDRKQSLDREGERCKDIGSSKRQRR